MTTPMNEVCCASFAAGALAVLADLRARDDIKASVAGGRAWVRWPAGDDNVLLRVLAVEGVELYARRGDRWHRFGAALPAFDFPEGLEFRPLHAILFPAPVMPVPAGEALRGLTPPARLALVLAPDARPRPASALTCTAAELARWADGTPAARLAALEAAWCKGRVLVLGARLPPLASGRRYWGEAVLVPLGFRPEPDLPPGAVRDALGLTAEELLLLDEGSAEVVPRSALRPLTRARARLAAREE